MAKAVMKKGKNRRLKRSVRKTLGALFLASALAVAAIPTEGLQAADGNAVVPPVARIDRPHTGGAGDADPMKVSIAGLKETPPAGMLWEKTAIPDVTGNEFDEKIYTSENLNLQFVVANMHTQNAYAVIVGYNNQMQQNNVGDKLTIPRTVDAYTSFMGRSCAIGGNHGELLFYRAQVGTDETVSGGDTVPVPHYEYRPCLFDNISTWKEQEYDENTNPNEGLYFISGLTSYSDPGYKFDDDGVPSLADGSEIPESTWRRATSTLTQRIKGIPVYYIGNQYVDVGATSKTQAKDVTADHGIFSGANVNSLVVEPNLVGIGNYAFAGTDIKTVELSNTIKEIGNYAFSGCPSLASFKIDDTATSVVIGDHAFSNCASLLGFDAKKVVKIGDSAFEGCGRLASVNMLIEGDTGALQNLGYYAFAACTSLGDITFPVTYGETIPISTFMRCINLKRIYATGNWPTMNFEERDAAYYSFNDFRQESNSGFYFEGAKGCDLEDTVVGQYFSYKYTGQEVYEKKVPDESSAFNDTDHTYALNAVFEVTRVADSTIGEITRVQIDNGLQNLKIPGVIGPLSVTAIGEGGFEDNHDLVSVVIPPTITSIGPRAFKGCHRLNSVIFEDASKISLQNIGTDAFATQSLGAGHTCYLDSEPKLYFTGAVESSVGPFQYAMDKNVFISSGSQTPTHITYYSGWPSNLTVENRDGVATLTNYPTIQQLMQQGGSFNSSNYPYFTMDKNYEPAAFVAFYKYLGMTDSEQAMLEQYVESYNNKIGGDYEYDLQFGSLNGYEQEIVNSTLNILLPEGIVAIEEGLFDRKEAQGDYKYLQSTGDLKEDTVSGGDITVADSLISANGQPLGKTFTVNLSEITKESFANCKMLETVNIGSGTEKIGDYAFMDCSYLKNVNIAQNVSEMGLVPFVGCNKLDRVNLNYIQPNNNFICEESVLFGRAADGTISKLIEYLNGADYQLPSKEVLARTTEIAEEAFRDTKIEVADFSESSITAIPRYAFSNAKHLSSVTLPHTIQSIEGFAFENSSIRYLYNIPSGLNIIESTAFGGVPNYCTFFSPEGSYAQRFSDNNKDHPNLKWKKTDEISYYTINFYYENEEGNKVYVHTEENVKAGDSVDVDKLWKEGAFEELPKEINGLVFKQSWLPKTNYTNVGGDVAILEVRAVYGEADKHTVTFLDKDNKVIWSNEVFVGGNIYIPQPPIVEGMTFSGWESTSPGFPGQYTIEDLDTITEDVIFRAVYTSNGGGDNPGGDDNKPGGDDNKPGGDDNKPGGDDNKPGGDDNKPGGDDNKPGGDNNNNNNNNNTNSGNSSSTNSGKYFTLTVINGHGSGSYVEGTQAIIAANDPAKGMEFSNWTIDPAGTKIASTGISATVITMPSTNVTVTAHYRAKTSSSNGSGTTSTANGGGRPNNTGTISNGGTTVVIDKNGISNTGVVAATVNGSSDNFVIKITENSAASEAVVRALMAEYGSLDNIKYFPMDISLYDSTGTNKITDTTGITVTITLPIPDSLITYAGNNRVAGVVNDKLDKLTPKFTTISGVSCITFTADHFSPYVIYADTANLSAGGNTDSTPKTGDGIHPKWFLSVGLACLSFVMFMQKDKRKSQKVKVKA